MCEEGNIIGAHIGILALRQWYSMLVNQLTHRENFPGLWAPGPGRSPALALQGWGAAPALGTAGLGVSPSLGSLGPGPLCRSGPIIVDQKLKKKSLREPLCQNEPVVPALGKE